MILSGIIVGWIIMIVLIVWFHSRLRRLCEKRRKTTKENGENQND